MNTLITSFAINLQKNIKAFVLNQISYGMVQNDFI